MTIDVYPEFGYEIVCSIPYAYWLHKQNKLDKVITCKGMKPFYFFCSNVEEKYSYRSIDNSTNGVQNLPNTWIHHNAKAIFGKDYNELSEDDKIKANGWLDYSQWECPPYKDYYSNNNLDLPQNFIVISNRYNLEHGQSPIGFFDIECLYNMITSLTEKGYSVIYKRPSNTEFATDPNELINTNITANVKGVGIITDYDLVRQLDNAYLLDDIIKNNIGSYNEIQLKIFSRANGFISMGGGSSTLCSCFKVPVVIYVNTSGDIRPGYFEGESYFKKLSNADIYPIIDKKDDIIARGYRDYSKLYNTVYTTFN